MTKRTTVFCMLLLVSPGAFGQVCPEVVVEWDIPQPTSDAFGIAIDGTYAYIVIGFGMHVVDVSVPSSPKAIGYIETPGSALSIALEGDLAYVADGNAGLRIIDISIPSAPKEVGSLGSPLFAEDVAISGTIAYVANSRYPSHGLAVVDISKPEDPVQISDLKTPDAPYDVVASGRYTLVGVRDYPVRGGVHIVDTSDPVNPTEVGYYRSSSGAVANLEVSRSFAYVTTGLYFGPVARFTFVVLDISDPAKPTELSTLWCLFGCGEGGAVQGDMVYLSQGTVVVDASVPKDPLIVSHPYIYFTETDVAVSGDLAYYVSWERTLSIYDISACGPARIFADGFESGSTSAWSLTVNVEMVAP